MALKSLSLSSIPFSERIITIRIQEFDPAGNGRPYEEDLTEDGWHADSIGDIPLVGDYIGLWVDRMVEGTGKTGNPEFENVGGTYKILSRYFSYPSPTNNYLFCNLVVQLVTDDDEVGRLNKD